MTKIRNDNIPVARNSPGGNPARLSTKLYIWKGRKNAAQNGEEKRNIKWRNFNALLGAIFTPIPHQRARSDYF